MKILTIDLEDWFHILDHPDTAHAEQWERFESRVERNTDRILEALDQRKLRATFFVLGWIAERFPDLIRRVALHHEIACHSYNHQLLYQQSRTEFAEDLKKCISTIEQITGEKVRIYRAPGFSLQRDHHYVFEELCKRKIEIDASVFPAKRNHGGIAGFPFASPCLIKGSNFLIKEFPMSTSSFFGKQIVFSGGGYFRILPYSIIRSQMKASDYVMTYFHPRDFDHEQPMIQSLPLKRKFMSYVGLKSSFEKFCKMLDEFPHQSIGEVDEAIEWTQIPVVHF
jgi:polysaccharide deacetylase family protein (PEP-CTERM system associated)